MIKRSLKTLLRESSQAKGAPTPEILGRETLKQMSDDESDDGHYTSDIESEDADSGVDEDSDSGVDEESEASTEATDVEEDMDYDPAAPSDDESSAEMEATETEDSESEWESGTDTDDGEDME